MGLFDKFLGALTTVFDFPLAEKAKINRILDVGEREIEYELEQDTLHYMQQRLGPKFHGTAKFHVRGVLTRPTWDDCMTETSRRAFATNAMQEFEAFRRASKLGMLRNTVGDDADD